MEHEPKLGESVTNVVQDAQTLLGAEVQLARREALDMAIAAAAQSGAMGFGAVLASFGVGLLLAAPVVPRAHRRVRRRMLATATLYLLAGGASAAMGVAALRQTFSDAFHRSRRQATRAVGEIKEEVTHGQA